MSKLKIVVLVFTTMMATSVLTPMHQSISAQVEGSRFQGLSETEKTRILSALENKQKEIAQVLSEYAYKREIRLQTIAADESVESDYHRISEITYDDKGEPIEKVLEFPKPKIKYKEYRIGDRELKAWARIQEVAIPAKTFTSHNFVCTGKEPVEGRDAFVFRVFPAVEPTDVKNPYFKGKIWVDCADLQITKAEGKFEPDKVDGAFPTVKTTCVKVDDRYWLPAEALVDQVLRFESGHRFHTRQLFRLSEYRKFRTTVKVLN